MSSRASGARPGRRPSKVLVFAESLNDSKSLMHLLIGANQALDRRVMTVPRPTSLTRQAGALPVRNWVEEISRTVRGYEAAGTSVVAALVHRDADGPDPHGKEEQRLRDQLAPLAGEAVVPVQMIEAWWFLFPGAVETIRPIAWKGTLPRRARDVELIHDPKSELARLTGRGRTPGYTEADSVDIAEAIRRMSPRRTGRSASYDRFLALARSIA